MPINHKYAYLGIIGKRFSNCYTDEEIEACIGSLTPSDISELAGVYDTIEKKGEAFEISRWLDDCLKNIDSLPAREKLLWNRVGRLFVIFSRLGARGISPFSNNQVRYIERMKVTNWSSLPASLQYLGPFAEKHGKHYSEAMILAFIADASQGELDELNDLAGIIHARNGLPEIQEWIASNDDRDEAWLMYCLLGVLDHLGLL